MSTLSQGLGAAGVRHSLTHEGRTYGFRPFSGELEDGFQKALYARACAAARKLPSVAGADDPAGALAAKLEALERQFLSGGFEMESEAGQEFLRRLEGKVLLLQLIVVRPDGDTNDQFKAFLEARDAEVAGLIDLVLCESLPAYAKARERRKANGQSDAPVFQSAP